MEWRELWRCIRQRSRAWREERHLEDLRQQLQASRQREQELLRAIERKDAQIQMVLEAQFYRPHGDGTLPQPQAAAAYDPELFSDVTTFGEAEDAAFIRKMDGV